MSIVVRKVELNVEEGRTATYVHVQNDQTLKTTATGYMIFDRNGNVSSKFQLQRGESFTVYISGQSIGTTKCE